MTTKRPPGPSRPGGGVKEGAKLSKLVVDGHSQGLERAGRRVDSPTGAARHGAGRDLRQVAGVPHGPGPDDGPRDAPAESLVGEPVEQVRQLPLAPAIDEVPRAQLLPAVEAHVQRALQAEAEAPAGIVQLRAGQPQVREDPREGLVLPNGLRDPREGAVTVRYAALELPQAAAAALQRRCIAVDGHEPAAGCPRENPPRMAARAGGAVAVGATLASSRSSPSRYRSISSAMTG